MLTLPHRKFNRATWKYLYRQYRIVVRESWKAHMDMVLFGSGYVKIGSDIPDYIRHVPIEDVVIMESTEESS